MKKQFSRNCPICNESKGEILHIQEFLLERGNPLPDRYDIVQCYQCGFIFSDTNAGQELYDIYYQNFSKYEDTEIGSGSGGQAYDEKRLKETIRSLEAFLESKESRILDIGSGNGGMLRLLGEKGFSNLSALDPSSKCVAYMKGQSIEAVRGSLFDDMHQHFGTRKFDLIILSHVLEHIRDLHLAVKNISGLLDKNGVIYIEVPDARRYKDFFLVPYYYFDIEHINHFTQRSLTSLMMLFGLSERCSGTKELEISNTIRYPALFTFYTNGRYDDAEAVIKFVDQSNKEKGIASVLESIMRQKKSIVVWGAGNYTKRLLATTKLKNINIDFFVDKDRNKQGASLNGIEIKSPDALHSYSGTVVIASALYTDDIYREAISRFPQSNIIVLGMT
ncbi:class I SAM-dependent methyltransferase [Sulfurovum sp. NBC37-1]|uniref:class I SAM-dependent methyltransferase n=1 Tax=Sulfurovum sp. (strain NBC37-1) TaxID=387093 RepID=UPI0001587BD2|nr:class I SAM-dependent methyltransferase [Sulfurovum sp. NBC37-1]BAF73079.1 conserved hypothetical protein [Sulfurovum sp. NBC37-1]